MAGPDAAGLLGAHLAAWPADAGARCGALALRVRGGLGQAWQVEAGRDAAALAEDVGQVEDACDAHDARPAFAVTGEGPLALALHRRGYRPGIVRALFGAAGAPHAAAADRDGRSFALWPPLAIQHRIWREILGAEAPDTQGDAGPRTALLARIGDHAAGAGLAARQDGATVIAALAVAPASRRQGGAAGLIRQAAAWGETQGGGPLVAAVHAGAGPALALFRGLGFARIGEYALWYLPG